MGVQCIQVVASRDYTKEAAWTATSSFGASRSSASSVSVGTCGVTGVAMTRRTGRKFLRGRWTGPSDLELACILPLRISHGSGGASFFRRFLRILV
ncbi:MAG: hypothetical protein E6Q53_00255 [Candidatus Moraniibacteriota bacterium]|nr:MAG: hypothetical protein E6Q53_00255 [Candidatus Moranbacteria bacterium]